MPHEQMTAQQVAQYIHLDYQEVVKLASRGKLPGRRVGGDWRFIKSEVDHWVETQLGELHRDHLHKIDAGVTRHHGFEPGMTVWNMLPEDGLAVPLESRTREGVLRDLVDLAEACGLVYVKDELLREIRQREDLCSTSIIPGVAMPHPHHPVPYDISESFVVGGVTPSGIPFGADDGSLTRLFFLVCCKDDRTHLHVLARLALMLHDDSAVEQFVHAQDDQQLAQALHDRERDVLKQAGGR